MIPKAIVDKILETAQIEEVVGDFVALKRAGTSYKANSPFTDERTPSFYVAPAKNIFKDFSSGKGGNAATFLMEHEQMSYPQALRWLAEKYNIEIPEREATPEEQEAQSERESMQVLLNYAAQYYHEYLLNQEEGQQIGLPYCKERGLSEPVIQKFQLGYAPAGPRHFVDHALNQQYQAEYLERTGLAKKGRNDQLIDQFRDRLLFPIHSLSGKTLGFGGRTLRSNGKEPKYLNTPETEIYDKSNTLYGLYQAKSAIRKHDRCLLVEGYTDVLALHQAGVEEVVASSGTSLTEGQMKLIKRFSSQLIFMYDSDDAGVNATLRGVDLALQQGLAVKVLQLPDGHDPDTFAQAHDADSIQAYIENEAQDFLTFKLAQTPDDSQNDPVKQASVVRSIVKSIAQIPDSLTRDLYLQQAVRELHVSETLLYQELNQHLVSQVKRQASPEAAQPEQDHTAEALKQSRSGRQEQEVVRILLEYGDWPLSDEQVVADYLAQELRDIEWESGPCYTIWQLYQEHLQETGEHPELRVFTEHEDQTVQQLAVDVVTYRYGLSENWEARTGRLVKAPSENYQRDVDSALKHLKLQKIVQLLEQNEEELKQASSTEKVDELLQVHNYLNTLKQEITNQLEATIIG